MKVLIEYPSSKLVENDIIHVIFVQLENIF